MAEYVYAEVLECVLAVTSGLRDSGRTGVLRHNPDIYECKYIFILVICTLCYISLKHKYIINCPESFI